MKILLLGSLVSAAAMEELNRNSKEKASIAPVNYETMLVKGLQENGVDVEALSVPAVAAYPNSIYKYIKNKHEVILKNIDIHWLPFVNIQLLKQYTIKKSTYRLLEKWLKENNNIKDKVVMMYSIYPPYTAAAVELCRKYNCHLTAVIADLPEYMYTWKNSQGLRGRYASYLQKQMLDLQGACDSYILFTQKMAERMGIGNKPYLVSEGLSDTSIYDGLDEQEKYPKKTMIYAGNLSKLYGIKNLVDGFMQTKGDFEFRFYGAGQDAQYITECAASDARIKYFGRVPREEILIALQKAHLIVINKPTEDDYSNYSFSSKILECMLSGTPVLTTKVGGMPKDYYEHFYFIEDETPAGIAKAIATTMASPDLLAKGCKARNFAIENKNYLYMTEKMLSFLSNILEA